MKPVRLCFCGLCTSFSNIPIVLISLAIKTVALIILSQFVLTTIKQRMGTVRKLPTYSIVVSIFDVCPPSQPASASNNVKTQRFDWFRWPPVVIGKPCDSVSSCVNNRLIKCLNKASFFSSELKMTFFNKTGQTCLHRWRIIDVLSM